MFKNHCPWHHLDEPDEDLTTDGEQVEDDSFVDPFDDDLMESE